MGGIKCKLYEAKNVTRMHLKHKLRSLKMKISNSVTKHIN